MRPSHAPEWGINEHLVLDMAEAFFAGEIAKSTALLDVLCDSTDGRYSLASAFTALIAQGADELEVTPLEVLASMRMFLPARVEQP